jgi:hypothetical protein
VTVPAEVVVSSDWESVLTYLGLAPRSPETKALVLLCERYGLDPLLGHASIITTKQGFKPYITRDGLLEIAHRSGQLDGIVTDELRRNSSGDGWTAYVSVYRKDMGHPFRYGAQCKDTEAQAKLGNGPEMALARAERRALKRAFAIPADDGVADADIEVIHVDNVRGEPEGPAVLGEVDGPAPPEQPVSAADQNAAHKTIGLWDADAQQVWMSQWGIDTFEEAWPADAVADALSQPF